MFYPTVNEIETTRDMISAFGGYNHNPVISDGEWFDCQNLSTNLYPLVSQREDRKKIQDLVMPVGIFSKDGLSYIKNDGTVVLNGQETRLKIKFFSLEPKQFVSIGAYVCIFPDKVYINSADLSDYGSMEESHVTTGTRNVFLCDQTGKTKTINYKQTGAPANPKDGERWMDTTNEEYVLRKWFASSSTWIEEEDNYVKFPVNAATKYKSGQSIMITGFSGASAKYATEDQLKALDGLHVITKISRTGDIDWIVMPGYINYMSTDYTVTPNGSISFDSLVPDLDYVCECGNRLWGCYYGMKDGELINELYCSKLGDFKDWRCYAGLSTDSWAASCGTDGKWTGCITYAGYPTFFKENYIHKIYVSSTGAHQVTSSEIRGLQDGASNTLKIVNETLFYKNRTGVMAYTGSTPTCVSQEFGEELYKAQASAAGAMGNKYYIAMYNSSGLPEMFVYDVKKGLWQKENGIGAISFATHNDTMWMMSRGGKLYGIGIDTEVYPLAEMMTRWNGLRKAESLA